MAGHADRGIGGIPSLSGRCYARRGVPGIGVRTRSASGSGSAMRDCLLVILRLRAGVCPLCPGTFRRSKRPDQQRLRGGAVQVRGSDRSVPHPSVHGDRVVSTARFTTTNQR